ncbi:MAG TPA: DUF4013 domain-containing protein [Thermoanaerobaculaceae bacterium]|nr:DUF4013 domain-containing protein [Thermoanaerobaculaceae bacterium]
MSDTSGSLAYPFRHRAWLGRVLVGAALDAIPVVLMLPAVFALARHRYLLPFHSVVLVSGAAAVGVAGRLLVLGYLGRAAREVIDGTSTGLPPWDRMAEDLVQGIKLALVALALWLPAVGATVVLALLVMALASPSLAWLPVILVGPPAALLTLAYLPAGLLAMVTEGEASAAFDFERVTGVAGRAFGPYAIAFLVAFGAEILAQLGLVLCCVGIFATRFAAHCVAVHAFGSAYRQGLTADAGAAGAQPGAGLPAEPPPAL